MHKFLTDYENELRLRNYSERTISCYLSLTKLFIEHFRKDPSEIGEDEIKTYLRGSSSQALLKQRIGALKRFYQFVIKQPLKFKYISKVQTPDNFI